MTTNRAKKEIKTDFLNVLGVLILAASPLKDQLQQLADKQRGKLLNSIDPDVLELYTGGRDVITSLADQLIKADDLEQVAKVLKVVQGITQGVMYEYEDPNDEAVSQAIKDLLLSECHLNVDNVTIARLISTVRGLNLL